MKLTDAQLAILEDLADENPRTRMTRSNVAEWKVHSPYLITVGFIYKGTREDARRGKGHTITDAGRTALAAARKETP